MSVIPEATLFEVCLKRRNRMAFWMGKRDNTEVNKAQKEPQKEPHLKSGGTRWISLGVFVCLVVSILFTMLYGMFRVSVENQCAAVFATENNAGWLYQNTYLLYRDLYNSQNQVQESYISLYLEPDEGYEWITEENILNNLNRQTGEEQTETLPQYEDSMDNTDVNLLLDEISGFQGLFMSMEEVSGTLNGLYDYCIRDNNTGYYMTNMSDEYFELASSDAFFRLDFSFDNAGNVTVSQAKFDPDDVSLRFVANQAVRDTLRLDLFMETFNAYGTVGRPRSCTVSYYVPYEKWRSNMQRFFQLNGIIQGRFSNRSNELDYYIISGYYVVDNYWLYMNAGVGGWVAVLSLAVLLLGCFLPMKSSAPWRENGPCSLSIEFLAAIGFCVFGGIVLVVRMAAAVASSEAVDAVREFLTSKKDFAIVFVMGFNLVLLTLFYFVSWYLGVSLRALREMGLRDYIRKRSLIYRFFPFIKRQMRKVYSYFVNMDLTQNASRTILKVVIVNALILFVISSLWLGGLMVTVIYSVLLYFLLRKYVSDLQKRYGILLKAVDEMAEGNLNVTINEDLGVFEPFKPQVIKIQSGFKKAVDEEVKSQHMRAELITNVSHDLKTPLTAIITYVNLLKDENLSEEKRKEYLDTLERKSLRLKVLIEDLFEVSKATSGNVTLNLMPVDIMSLIKQVSFEMKDKLDEAELDIRMNLTDEKVVLPLDSQKTYRIYENLFGNIAKYALKGTRVYINGFRIDDTVVITFKNISAQEITVDSADLTERFVRGDASRNTEGSGLGLAITKSFIELQGGELQLEVDGDLFKATTIWKILS